MGKVKFNGKGRPYATGRLVKSDEYRDYQSICIHWALRYRTALGKLKEEIIKRRQLLKSEGKELTLKIEFFAVFPHSKLFTSKGALEPLDSDNRLKPGKDALFTVLCLDDKHVFRDEIEKITGEKEEMIVRITEHIPRTQEEIKSILGL